MKLQALLPMAALLPLQPAQAVNVVLGNDDGWAEINIRTFFDDLVGAGYGVVLSAPAENESGTGSSDAPATPLTEPCEFNTCPTGSPAEGYNASDPRLNYVNSYPVTAINYGIDTLAPQFFRAAPDIAVAGPNVGSNLGITVEISGTVGAATAAALAGIPGIAFSGTTGSQTSYASPPADTTYITNYAALSTTLTTTLTSSGTPYLPSGVWLNVNFPASSSSTCASPGDFSFVLSRIYDAIPILTPDDVETCGSSRLPTESTVVGTDGCYVSVSVGVASSKSDASAAEQAVVLEKLGPILSCLP